MKALKIVSLAILVIILLTAAVGVFLPSRVSIERQISIMAPTATVFALANDLYQQQKWSPWAEQDPNAQFDFSGPRRGVGAKLAWDGEIIGQGKQSIVESTAFSRVVSHIEFRSDAPAVATLALASDGLETTVRWSLQMDFGRNLVARYFGLFTEKLVGRDYEKGLQNLKSMAEGLPQADFANLEIKEIMVEAEHIAYLPTSSPPQAGLISDAMGKSFFKILSSIDRSGLQPAGPPISISRTFSGGELLFDVAIPVTGNNLEDIEDDSGVQLGMTYAGPALRVRHVGPYRQLAATHARIAAYIAALGIERNGDAWESYVSDPTQTEEDELITFVFYPVTSIVPN